MDTDIDHGLGRRLLRNMSVQLSAQVVLIGIGLVTTTVLARKLAPEAFGGFNYLFSFIYIFLALSDLGTGLTLVREIAQAPARTVELVQNVLGLRLALSAMALLVGWIAIAALPIPPAYALSLRVFMLILPIQAYSVLAVILQARLQLGRGSFVELANRLTGFVLMMLSIWFSQGLLFVTMSLVCGEIVGALTVIALTYRVAAPIPRFDFATWTRILRLSLPLSGNGLLVALLNKLDTLMLQAFLNMTQVGYYTAAYKVPNLVERVPQLAMATLFPVMSRLAVTDPVALKRLYRKMLGSLFLLVVPMLGGVIWLAPFIVRWLLGFAYGPVVPLLRVVILATALVYLSISGGNLLIALNRSKVSLYAMGLATVVNATLNVLWIPRFGTMGAAWATVVGYAILCVMTLVMAEMALTRAIRLHREAAGS
jgi:O-antigen/teichoic acid export membrane protein